MFVPEECYKDFGKDLDSCSGQSLGGCPGCSYRKKTEQEVKHGERYQPNTKTDQG